jgi:hypothetical protein
MALYQVILVASEAAPFLFVKRPIAGSNAE